MTEPPAASVSRGQRGISEALREFTAEFPFERGPILDFVLVVARGTPTNASVLDLGAGNAPYRELFAHTHYQTNDWTQSLHAGAVAADIVAPADALPVADSLFDLVLCTQVLEHVPEPSRVLDECRRVLVAGGRLALSVPLLWELHELPHDYYRYTSAGLRHLLEKSGFQEIEIEPRSDGFSAVAQLMRNLGWGMGDADDGLTSHRVEARRLLHELADEFSMLAELDVNRTMPLGYTALAVNPVNGTDVE